MDIAQRRRLFEIGESVIAEAILDVLREAGEPMRTGEVVRALGLPDSRGRAIPPHPERHICISILTRLAESDRVERIPLGQGYQWFYIPPPYQLDCDR